jgi:HSP20 family protein
MANNGNLANVQHGSVEPVQQRETVAPPVDVYENSDELLLMADVPGANQDGIEVQLDKGQLTIRAKRVEETPGHALANEFRSADYLRMFSVPQGIEAAQIDAQLSHGVLRLRLPKSQALRPRRIEVKQG